MNQTGKSSCAKKGQCGHTLLVALVFMIATGMLSATLLNATLELEKLARSSYSQIKAELAASTALRYCESIVEEGKLAELKAEMTVSIEYGNQWLKQENWVDSFPGYRKVPASWVAPASIQADNKNMPECLIEISSPETEKSYLITARGYSEDFQVDTRGKSKSGARIWLQEKVRVL